MTVSIFKINIQKGLMFLAIALLSACNNSETGNTSESIDTSTVKKDPNNYAGFYDIPPPIHEVQLLQKAGATYDNSILNPLENVSKYSVINAQALNLGIYGADLSYAAVFNQPQDAILYLAASKKLADALNIKGDFYNELMKRMEKNSGNKDSLLQIVSDLYRGSNASLKENDQSHISALVVVGSFIEALYVSTQVAKNVENKEAIYQRIADFKDSLDKLVALVTTVHDNDFLDILSELKSINILYDELDKSKLDPDLMTKITKQVKAVRIKITNM